MSEPTCSRTRTELKPEDFGRWDRDDIECAGSELFGVLANLIHHNYAAGDGWYPFAEDIPGILAEVRNHIVHLEAAIKKAKADIAAVERPARLAAYRRQKREAK
jgi:hypothetical protein